MLEYIGKFSSENISNPGERKSWYDRIKNELLEDKIEAIIEEIKSLAPKGNNGQKIKDVTIKYLENNAFRMRYKTYQDQGLNIGSGAIESAHRTVIQRRLKLSGQRWSKDGAQRILKLEGDKYERLLGQSGGHS